MKQNWPEIQIYFDEGHTAKECQEKYGYSYNQLYNARVNGEVDIGERKLSLERYMKAKKVHNSTLKKRLIKAGLLVEVCSICGIEPFWNGMPLVLQMDHIDGNDKNNALENLRLLCPNCHTQTLTWGKRKYAIIKL